MQVIGVNRSRRVVMLEDGTELPIVYFYDWEGDETDNPTEAATCVAGPVGDKWLSVNLSVFDTPRVLH